MSCIASLHSSVQLIGCQNALIIIATEALGLAWANDGAIGIQQLKFSGQCILAAGDSCICVAALVLQRVISTSTFVYAINSGGLNFNHSRTVTELRVMSGRSARHGRSISSNARPTLMHGKF